MKIKKFNEASISDSDSDSIKNTRNLGLLFDAISKTKDDIDLMKRDIEYIIEESSQLLSGFIESDALSNSGESNLKNELGDIVNELSDLVHELEYLIYFQ